MGKRSLWDYNLAIMHNGKCRTLRTELVNACQGGEPPGDTPRDQLVDAWGMTWAEETTTAPEAVNPDTQADDLIGMVYPGNGKGYMREVTSDGD